MLLQKINNKQARIGVIGLGYVGLPLVIEFCKAGYSVTGLDIDKKKIEMLSQGKSYIKHIPDESIRLLTLEDSSALYGLVDISTPPPHPAPQDAQKLIYTEKLYK